MAYQQRDNSGTLGKNRNRQKDTHPEYNGKCIIDGQEYYISAWVKDGQNGAFFSLSFKPKEDNGGYSDRPRSQSPRRQRSGPIDDDCGAPPPRQQRRPPPPAYNDEFDDDIPF